MRPSVNAPPDPAAAFGACIGRRGLKSTRQRQAILKAFLAAGGHLTADELLARARKADPGVSPATVYRTLRLLADCGVTRPQQFDGSQTTYEILAGRGHHDHLVCTRCGRVVEFEHGRIEALQLAVARAHGFTVTSHRLELYGLCRRCRDAARASRKRATERQPHAQGR